MKKQCLGLGILVVLALGLTVVTLIPKKDESLRPHKMHNGGKPRPNIDLSTSEDLPLVADAWTMIPITFTPQEECQELSVRFHGLDGLQVENPEELHELGSCDPGFAVQTEVRVRGSSGTAGYLVADVSLDGRISSRTLPFSVGSAKHRPKLTGKTKLAPDGSTFIELNPKAQ